MGLHQCSWRNHGSPPHTSCSPIPCRANGDVRERYQRWAASQRVPAERLLAGLRALAEELRRRTGELVGLPQGEEVIFELVRDKPWAGNADYLGDFRTRVRINQDLPIASMRPLELASHEAYPGHHTEQVLQGGSPDPARTRGWKRWLALAPA